LGFVSCVLNLLLGAFAAIKANRTKMDVESIVQAFKSDGSFDAMKALLIASLDKEVQ
jgi:hypothetical protein